MSATPLTFDLASEPTNPLAFLVWWARRWFTGQPHRKIHGDDYLHRWYVLPRNPWLNVYLHRYFGPDKGTDPHDHPWDSISLCLRGSYVEELQHLGGWVHRVRGPASVVFRKAESLHRIVTVAPGKTWTLFSTRHKRRKWGFLMRQIDGSYRWVAYDAPERQRRST